MALLAARMFSWNTAFHVVLLCQGILLFNGAALIATPDGMLLPCWAGATFHASHALKKNRFSQWLATGFWFGLGLLSKYTMLLFLPSLFLCILFIKPYRLRLFHVAPWLGLIFGLVMFTPVLIWNSNNEWATFRHVLYMGGLDTSSFFTLRYVGDFLAEQFALLSPLVFCLVLLAWITGNSRQYPINTDVQFLVWMSLPTFLVFLLLSLHSRVYGNWPAAGYLTAMVLIAYFYSSTRSSFKNQPKRIWKLTVFTAYLITLPIMVQVIYPILPVPVKYDRTAREAIGWDHLGINVAEVMDSMNDSQDPFIFAIRYQHSSELAVYVPGQPRTVSINQWHRPNVYDYWFNDKMLIGRDGVGVIDNKDFIKLLKQVFVRVEFERKLPVYRTSPWRGRELVKTYYIVKAYGFKGGQRWKPREADDIRATKKQTSG
jgi:undecaprenyl-diphosphatase